MPSTYSALSEAAFTFFDLDELSVFIDSTYWYFLKAQANGVLLRWLNELLVPGLARSHLAGTACIIIQNRRMRVLSPKFLRLTSPGEQRSDDYIRPTFTPPRHACFQLITHTNMHTRSQYRWIHTIVKVTLQEEMLLLYVLQKYTIIRCTWNFSKDASLRVSEPKTAHDCASSKWPPDDWERNFSQAFAQA